MARIFIDGFEGGDGSLWDYGSRPSNIYSTGAFDGTYRAYSTTAFKRSGFSFSEVYVAFRVSPSMHYETIAFLASGVTVACLHLGSTGYIQAYRGSSSGTLVATGTNNISEGEWHLFEVHYLANDSTGRWEVKVDGIATLDIDYTGDTTSAGTTIDAVQFCGGSFDNIIFDDAAWIGDTRIQAIFPSGAGATTQWDPSTGSNYACVDEKPPSDTDYISTNVSDEIDTYAFGNLAGTISSVKCVQVQARALKEGASTPTKLALMSRVASTDYPSADKTLTVNAQGYFDVLNVNPNTSAAWLEAGVNGSEFGVKSRA